MGKITSILLASVLTVGMVASLAGCGESEDSKETTTEDRERETVSEETMTTDEDITSEEIEIEIETVSEETMTTNEDITPEETEQATVSRTIETTVDGYVTTMEEIPEAFFAQCEAYGKNLIFERQDTVCYNNRAGEYIEVDDIDSIKCVYWYFVTRDEPSEYGDSYFSQQAKNALCFLYEYRGITRFTEKSGKGHCEVYFEDVMGEDGILQFSHCTYLTAQPDSNLAKNYFRSDVTNFNYKIIGSPSTDPNYS